MSATPSALKSYLMSHFTLVLTLTVATTLIAPHRAGAQEASSTTPQYRYTALSAPFPGVTSTLAYGINNLDEVVGAYQIDTAQIGDPPNVTQHGYVSKRGTYIRIDVPFSGATNTVAAGINNLREVVGTYLGADGSSHGFTLKNGVFASFDFPGPDAIDTTASAINDAGTIVGYYYDLNSQQTRGFVSRSGKFTSIDAPFGDACSTRALGINNRDEIVGDYIEGDIAVFGFTLKQGKFESVNWSFPPDFPNPFADQNALPTGINNHGMMVGPGFITVQGNFTQLSDMNPSLSDASATGVNDWGMVVGNVLQDGIPQSGFLLVPQ